MTKRYQPMGDKVLIQPPAVKTKSDSGILIPEIAQETKPEVGRVVAAGPGRILQSGERLPMFVKEGDIVLFGKFAGIEQTIGGQRCLIMPQDDILLVEVEDDDGDDEGSESSLG